MSEDRVISFTDAKVALRLKWIAEMKRLGKISIRCDARRFDILADNLLGKISDDETKRLLEEL